MSPTPFDVATLRSLAGERSFARGEVYQREGLVEILDRNASRVLARVTGTEDYRTELLKRGKSIEGACSCPAFARDGFCKHLVATALAANAAGAAGEPAGDGTVGRISLYLKSQGVDALAEMILELAERDEALFRKLDLAAAAPDEDDRAVGARLVKAINAATRIRGFLEYRHAPKWAAGVHAVLDSLESLAKGPRATLAMALAERALERIGAATEHMDDSDGHGGALLQRACDIHCAAASSARPDPVDLAGKLFAREMDDEYGFFRDSAFAYKDALGRKGRAEYRRLAEQAWEELPPLHGGRQASWQEKRPYDRLSAILDIFAERDGDTDARITLRAKDLSSPWRYLQLAEFCLAQGRKEEALDRALEGLWMFEDGPPDDRLLLFTVDLLVQAHREGEAEANLWRAFEKRPSIAIYKELHRAGGKAAAEKARQFLGNLLVADNRAQARGTADLLVAILSVEERFDEAWAIVRKFATVEMTRDRLARASEAGHPREAIGVYAARVDRLANLGGDGAYSEAVSLIARMATLQSASEQVAYVAEIKARWQRKRKFMAMLG